MTSRLDLWRRLVTPEVAPLLAELAACDRSRATDLERVRGRWGRDLVRVGAELVRAREKAARKFPEATRLVGDVEGVQQATSHVVATHKAARFAELGVSRVWDLCCGIGGDAMALALSAEVVAVDADPLRVWMAEHNVGLQGSRACEALQGDVGALSLRGEVFHLDPDRRRGGRRVWRYADYEPGPERIAELLAMNPDGAIKLGPGVRFADLPALEERELELVSHDGALVEAVLWSGRLARHAGERTATCLPEGLALTGTADPPPQAGGFSRYLVVADPAVERAELLGVVCNRFGLAEAYPGLGLLTASDVTADPWLTRFEVLEEVPWRPAKVRRWLRDHDAGVVEVKIRGGAANAERLRRELRGRGDQPFTVFVFRQGPKVRGVIARRR